MTDDKPDTQTALRTGERKEKAGLLKRRLVYDIVIEADDYPAFQSLFKQASEELLAWGRQRGRKAGGVLFDLTIHPWISGSVKQSIRSLRKSEAHAFLRGIPMDIRLTASDGEPIESIQLAVEEDQA